MRLYTASPSQSHKVCRIFFNNTNKINTGFIISRLKNDSIGRGITFNVCIKSRCEAYNKDFSRMKQNIKVFCNVLIGKFKGI